MDWAQEDRNYDQEMASSPSSSLLEAEDVELGDDTRKTGGGGRGFNVTSRRKIWKYSYIGQL